MTAREHLDQLDKLREQLRLVLAEYDAAAGDGAKRLAISIVLADRADDLLGELPEHTAALRAVLDLADQWDTDDDPRLNRNRIAKSTAAKAIRDALGALGDGAQSVDVPAGGRA